MNFENEYCEDEPAAAAANKQDGESQGADREADLSRREMIKLAAGATISVGLCSMDVTPAEGRSIESASAKEPRFFTPEEFSLVDELTEMIIPSDEHSPGARAAAVASYIDFRLSESWDEEPKIRWRLGLKLIESISDEMHGTSFLKCSKDQRIALLTEISKNEEKPARPEEVFFNELKSMTARAYYTSRIGIHTEMEYKGNTYLKEYVGYDAT